MGLNVKLDVGLYRLDQQVACQRYRHTFLDANSKISATLANFRDNLVALRDNFVATFAGRALATDLS